jgi:hypothetical protein
MVFDRLKTVNALVTSVDNNTLQLTGQLKLLVRTTELWQKKWKTKSHSCFIISTTETTNVETGEDVKVYSLRHLSYLELTFENYFSDSEL